MKQKRINRLMEEFGITQEQAERIYYICHEYRPYIVSFKIIAEIVMNEFGVTIEQLKSNRSRSHMDYFPRVCR